MQQQNTCANVCSGYAATDAIDLTCGESNFIKIDL